MCVHQPFMKHNYHYEHSRNTNNQPVYTWYLQSEVAENLIYCNWHEETEFIYIKKGTLHLYIDEKLTVLHQGEIGIVNSRRMHYGHPAPDTSCEIAVMLFDLRQLLPPKDLPAPKHLKALLADELWFSSHIAREMPCYNAVSGLLEQIFACLDGQSPAYELKIKALLFELLFLFAETDGLFLQEREWGTSKTREKKEKLLQLIQFLQCHYQEELCLSALADAVYMGKDSFYKFMISMTGSSPISFVNQFRLNIAAKLLQDTTLSITEICFQTGFSNVSYFIRSFRHYYGCTPGKYR